MRVGSDRLVLRPGFDPYGVYGFENAGETASEDRFRAVKLVEAADHGHVPRPPALDLARRLKASTLRFPEPTLASSCYMTHLRRTIVSNDWFLIHNGCDRPVAMVTLIPPRAVRKPSQLQRLKPEKFMPAIYGDLHRAAEDNGYPKLSAINGWAHGFLHGEFTLTSELYYPHSHWIVTGDMIDLFDELRHRKKYRPSDAVKRPVVINRQLHSLPSPLTYVLKRYWPGRWRGLIGDDRKAGDHRRIPDPHLARQLLWIDQYSISDIELRIGLTNDRNGHLVLTA